jgi:hypothetical protein
MPKNTSPRARAVRRPSHRQLSVRGILRAQPNLQKIAGTMAALAIAEAEKAAQDQDAKKKRGRS